MVTFKPFAGYRPAIRSGETVGDRISPPCDSIPADTLADLQAREFNVTNLTLKQDEDRHYKGARALLDRMVSENVLRHDEPTFYYYEQTFTLNGEEHRRHGITGLLKTVPYTSGEVLPHEDTSSKLRNDRAEVLRDTDAQLESIFALYKGLGADLERKVDSCSRLLYRFVDGEGVEHRFCRIADEEVCRDISATLESQKVVIADGHHRYEAALAYAQEHPDDDSKQYVLCTLVSSTDSGLSILPTHRLIDAEDIGETSAIKKIGKRVTLTETDIGTLRGSLKDHRAGILFRSGRCFFIDPQEGFDGLDASFVKSEIINGIYKSDEGKSKVGYCTDFDTVVSEMTAKKHDAAVILNPVSAETVVDYAESGRKMPPKTTCFYPKIWSGFVFYIMH